MATKDKSKSQIMKRRARREKKSFFYRLFKWALILGLAAVLLIVAAAVGAFFYLSEDLPKISSLHDYQPPLITTVFSDDGRKIAEFYKERRIIVALDDMPDRLKQAFIAAEDARFYQHRGIDLLSIVRAFFKNLEAGTIVQGGSTITQQVTKSFFLTPERSYSRKIKEAILAYRIDKALQKDEILYLYLNQICLGHGAYGVEAAAENYYGKSVKDLSLAECAILAGLPQAPSRYSPFRYPKRAKQRQIYVLNRMVAEGFITNIEATEAMTQQLDIKPRRNWYIERVPYYTEYIRQYIEKRYGEQMLYTGGLQVHAAVNIDMQKIAREEILRGLQELDKRQGYRGPLEKLPKEKIEERSAAIQAEIESNGGLEAGKTVQGIVLAVSKKKKAVTVRMGQARGRIAFDDLLWARKPNTERAYYEDKVKNPSRVLRTGDLILVRLKSKRKKSETWDLSLDQVPLAQSALLSIEADSGHVKVMVGGRDFKQNQFNRAIQSRRQPGSAFKPIIYAGALDKGYTPATVMYDSPVVFKDADMDFTWKPKNYSNKFTGRTLLRNALAKSLNVVTIKILQDIGIDFAIDYARRLGIESHMNRDLSIALGSSGVSLLELVGAYAVFNNMGFHIEPIFVTKVLDRNGNLLEENVAVREKVLEQNTAYIMTSLLEGVVKHGTGRRVRALKRPVAGKTGTTNNLYDAWFVGYTPRYVTGAWVGFDEEASLGRGETGSRAASPIWLRFMLRLLTDKPIRVFQVPEGVVFAKIDADTGLLPIAESEKTIFECFKEGTTPTEYTKKPGTVTESEQFFKLNM